jgi:hypothetical protein
MAKEATRFLLGHSWCKSIVTSDLAFAVAGVLNVFLFRIESSCPGVDDRLWVVVGDLPPAYLVHHDTPTWQDAVTAYIREMERWVAAVRTGKALHDIIPVAAEPTLEHAELLSSRLRFIADEILALDEEEIESDT